jgi:recombination protein RecR
MSQYPSKSVEQAVFQISRLPGIGKKSALRIALHLLKQDISQGQSLAQAIEDLVLLTKTCSICFNLSDNDTCDICANPARDETLICIVQDTRDVIAIENTAQFKGKYHVLGGLISPMEGLGPTELTIDALLTRIDGSVAEVILALSPTMEGDTTSFYLNRKLKEKGIIVSTIARGVPIGGEIEYADEITLGRSILHRTLQQ